MILAPVLPVFVLFLVGYFFKRFRKDHSEALVDIVIFFIFPLFVFRSLWRLDLDDQAVFVSILGILSVFLGFAIGFLVSKLLSFDRKTTATVMILSALGNTSFLGFPFVDAYYSEVGLGYATLFDQLATMLSFVIFGTIIASWGSGKATSGRFVFWQILKFPPFVALVLGIALNKAELPDMIIRLLDQVSLALLPLIILAVGMRFSLDSLFGNKLKLLVVLAIKMALLPFFIYMVVRFFALSGVAMDVAIIESAMPPMVLAALMAIKYELDSSLAIGAMGFGMILSFVTVPLIFGLIN